MKCFCCDVELNRTIQREFNKHTEREITYHLCKLCENSYFSQRIIMKRLSVMRGDMHPNTTDNEELFKELMLLGHNMMNMLSQEIRRELSG